MEGSTSDVICINENWVVDAPSYLVNSWSKFHQSWVPATKDHVAGRGSGGLSTLVRKSVSEMEIVAMSKRWIFCKTEICGISVIIGSVYLKPDDNVNEVLDLLDNCIADVMFKYEDSMFIIGGDFNAWVAEHNSWTDELFVDSHLHAERRSLHKKDNARGLKLIEILESHNMLLINGRVGDDYPGKMTYVARGGASVVDLVWVDIAHSHLVANLKVDYTVALSDHFPVTLTIYNPLSINLPTVSNVRTSVLSWSASKARDFYVAMEMAPNVLIDVESCTVEELYENFCSAVRNCATELCLTRVVYNGQARPARFKKWFDAECQCSQLQLNELSKALVESEYSNDVREMYIAAKKKHSNLVKSKKTKYYVSVTDKFANVNNSVSFWNVVKQCREFSPNIYAIPIDQWLDFYTSVYPPRANTNYTFYGVKDEYMDREITREEVISAIKRAKVNKAPGEDQIANEFYKSLPDNWIVYLTQLYNKIFDSEQIPAAWSCVLMTMLHKKGDKTDPANYRGIALVNSIVKIFTSIIKVRIEALAWRLRIIPETQAGFVANKGCLDNIFVLMSAINQQLRLGNRKVIALFIDFQRAFDSVNHKKLWCSLYKLGISAKTIRILKTLYDTASLRVKQGAELSDKVDITEGVLQGEILSPLLFILFLSDIGIFFRDRGARGISLDALHELLELMFADDLAFLCENEIMAQKIINILLEYVKWKGLKVNAKKSQVVVCKAGGKREVRVPIFLGAEKMEVTSSYNYLGIPIANSALGLSAAKAAVQKARVACSSALSILIKARSDSWYSNLKIFHSIVSATLLYGAPAWALRYTNMLETIQLYYFKRLYKLPKCCPGYLVRLELDISHIEVRVFALTLNWVIKVLYMDESRLPSVCLRRDVHLFLNRINNPSDKQMARMSKFNWVWQLNCFLVKIDEQDMWHTLEGEYWELRKEFLISKLRSYCKECDMAAANQSDSIQIKIPRQLNDAVGRYLVARCRWAYSAVMMQTKLATTRYHSFYLRGTLHQFIPTENCTLCNLLELDSVYHLLVRCPIFSIMRRYWLPELYELENTDNESGIICLTSFLCDNNDLQNKLQRLYYFILNALKVRKFLLNLDEDK